MSQNRFKSTVLNRFLNANETGREATSASVLNSLQTAATTALAEVSHLFKSNLTTTATNPQMETTNSFVSRLNSEPQASASNVFKVDKKLFEKLNKLSEKVLKHCQSDRMNLINSPPYIIDILPDICQVLNIINATYDSKTHVLNDIEYFNLMSKNLLDKLTKIVELFKQAGKRMYDEASEERARLTKYTLILSHMLAEMKSLFPKDVYEGQNFRIAKQDAAEFWRVNFKDKTIVEWAEFERKLNRVHKIGKIIFY